MEIYLEQSMLHAKDVQCTDTDAILSCGWLLYGHYYGITVDPRHA